MLGLSLQYLKFTGHLSRMLGDQLLTLKMSLKKKGTYLPFLYRLYPRVTEWLMRGCFFFRSIPAGESGWLSQ